jgi:hypothetical protein
VLIQSPNIIPPVMPARHAAATPLGTVAMTEPAQSVHNGGSR